MGRQGNTQRISRSSVVCLFLKKIFADERCAGLQAKNVKKAQKALQERCEACGNASLGVRNLDLACKLMGRQR